MKKICFVIIAMLVLTGCKTIKSAETHTENRTEVNVDSTDTAKVHSDSTGVEHKTSTTEKEKTHTEESSEREKLLEDSLKIYRQMSDSIGYYRSKIDSISNIKQDERIVEVEKQRSIKEKITTFLTDAVIGVIIFILVIWLVRLISKRP